MVARGEEGRIWRLDTDTGAFAIKELIIRRRRLMQSQMSPIRRPCSRPARWPQSWQPERYSPTFAPL